MKEAVIISFLLLYTSVLSTNKSDMVDTEDMDEGSFLAQAACVHHACLHAPLFVYFHQHFQLTFLVLLGSDYFLMSIINKIISLPLIFLGIGPPQQEEGGNGCAQCPRTCPSCSCAFCSCPMRPGSGCMKPFINSKFR